MKNKKVSDVSKEDQAYTSKGILLGVFLAIICNCIYLTSSILVKQYKLLAAEICFIRGLLQISLFFVVYIIIHLKQRHLKSKNNNIKNDNTKNDVEEANNSLEKQTVMAKLITQFLKIIDWKLAMLVSLCGISFGAMTLLAYIGVKLIPLSDFVVFGHTAPVFTLVLSALILG